MIEEVTPNGPVFCPICGCNSTAQYRHPGDHFVRCNTCGLTGPYKHSRDEAVRIWNTRYMCSAIDELMTELRQKPKPAPKRPKPKARR